MAVTQSILITMLVIAFTVAIGYEPTNVFLIFDLILAVLLPVMVLFVVYVVVWFIDVIEMEDQKWLVLKLMIALKEDDEAIKRMSAYFSNLKRDKQHLSAKN